MHMMLARPVILFIPPVSQSSKLDVSGALLVLVITINKF